MTGNTIKISLIGTFVIAFITYSFWEYVKNKTGVRIFYSGIAIAFVGYTFVINCLMKRLSKYENQFEKYVVISQIIFLTTINNLIDELLFDPTQLELNEYIGFSLIIIITYYGRRHDKRRKT